MFKIRIESRTGNVTEGAYSEFYILDGFLYAGVSSELRLSLIVNLKDTSIVSVSKEVEHD